MPLEGLLVTETAARLLSPVSCSQFLADWFEKRPLHVVRTEPRYYAPWVTHEGFTEALTTIHPDVLRLLSVKDDVRSGPVTWQRAIDAYRNGATIVANQLHLVMPTIARLCRGLEAWLHQPFQANAYLTPPGNQGFGAHFDVHDVFIIQVAGRKAWKVYQPSIPLPYSEQMEAVRIDGRNPTLDVVVGPGDLLYLPRGWIHEGRAVDGEASLHFAIGMVSFTWGDLLAMTLRDLSLKDSRLRETFRMGPSALPAVETATMAADLVMSLLHELQTRGLALADERFALARPAVSPRFPHPKAPITPETRFIRDPLVIAVLRRRGDDVELSFQGKSLPFPPEVHEALEFIVARDGPFRAPEMPGPLDLVNRIRLLQYLCDEGMLRRVSPGGSADVR